MPPDASDLMLKAAFGVLIRVTRAIFYPPLFSRNKGGGVSGVPRGGGMAPGRIGGGRGANFKSRASRAPRSVFFKYLFCVSIFVPGPKGLVLPKGAPRGGDANSEGGAPMQALTPGRWRPSGRHWVEPI